MWRWVAVLELVVLCLYTDCGESWCHHWRKREDHFVLFSFVLFVAAGVDVGSKIKARHEHNPYSCFAYKQTPHGRFCFLGGRRGVWEMAVESCVCVYLFVSVCACACCPLVYYSEKLFTIDLQLLALWVGIAWYVLSRVDPLSTAA